MMRRNPESRPETGDAGFSLTEVLVTLAVMSVVMVVFTGSLIQVFRTSGKAESISIIQGQLQTSFQRFDRQLRYASWIAQPGQVGADWYVEWADYNGGACYQLRFLTAPASSDATADTGKGILQMLSWQRGTRPAADAPAQTIAANLETPDSAGPFLRQDAGVSTVLGTGTSFTPDFERLRVKITARRGDSTAQVDTTFTALNTSRDTPDTNDCSQGRPA